MIYTNEEKLIMQATVVVKAICQGLGQTPLGVSLAEGTSEEGNAWRKEAEKYLQARYKGVKYVVDERDFNEELES